MVIVADIAGLLFWGGLLGLSCIGFFVWLVLNHPDKFGTTRNLAAKNLFPSLGQTPVEMPETFENPPVKPAEIFDSPETFESAETFEPAQTRFAATPHAMELSSPILHRIHGELQELVAINRKQHFWIRAIGIIYVAIPVLSGLVWLALFFLRGAH